METTCQVCEQSALHEGPCDGFGYKGACSMCSEFVHRDDGTLIHEDGTIFAPVKVLQKTYYEVQLDLFPVEEA